MDIPPVNKQEDISETAFSSSDESVNEQEATKDIEGGGVVRAKEESDDEESDEAGDGLAPLPTTNISTLNRRSGDEEDSEEEDDDDAPSELPTFDRRSMMKQMKQSSEAAAAAEKAAAEEAEPPSPLAAACEGFKYVYSTLLLLFSTFMVMAAIFTGQTIATADDGVHPALAFFIFWFLLCWLAEMEGGQGCLVGLFPIQKDLYQESHPKTYKNTTLAHKGNNMERFILGRQFLVVLVVFLSSMMSSPIPDAQVLNLPDIIQSVFLGSGLALILLTIIVGQLAAQVNAANCMLDFVNNYFMLYLVTYASLAIEFSGLLHCVYLVQYVFAIISGKPVESNETARSTAQNIFFWCRVVLSSAILAYAFAVTLAALFNGQTTMWEGVPPIVSVIIFFLLMGFVGLNEGMQIALFAVVNLPEEDLAKYPIAQKNCQLTFRGQNLQAFLIGRQILVTICMFIVARISTLSVEIGVDDNIFGVSDGVQAFFNTGLLGALITTIVASLAWRIIASSFPVLFLSNPLIYLIIRVCLILEASGICSAAWLLALVQRKVARFKPDDDYIGTAEERASTDKADDETDMSSSMMMSFRLPKSDSSKLDLQPEMWKSLRSMPSSNRLPSSRDMS